MPHIATCTFEAIWHDASVSFVIRMKRFILLTAILALTGGCYHDNASPFVHGAKNDPMKTGGTMVPPAKNVTEDTTTTMYDMSSGRPGGVQKTPPLTLPEQQ